ncbi:MAG: sulfite exporter TauE/SafE family protein [Yoonia sp.]|nr:sulfite exporter TauE/SafE family protein [Yoonia sp.]
MDLILNLMTPAAFIVALMIGLFAGLVKGMVGFGMPMIMISGMSTVLSPELALAGLILPTLVSNAMQAFRHGIAAAWASVCRFRLFLVVAGVVLIGSAQLVTVLPPAVLFLFIGVSVAGFALMQLVGWQPKVSGDVPWVEAVVGAFAGFTGGLSGIWGPPTVAYLTATNTPKADQVRVQGVIYGLGAVALFIAHAQSGIVRAETIPFSVILVIPAVIGMRLGFRYQDRIAQAMFKRLTLVVLLVAGLNLIRRGMLG